MINSSTAGYRVTEQQKAGYQRDGFLVVRGLFSADEVAEIRGFFDALAEKGEPVGSFWQPNRSQEATDPLTRYPRVMQPHRWNEMSKRYLLDARVRDILAALLEEEPIGAQTMYYFKPPGAKGQALHQDNFYLHVKPNTCMAAWTAIDPCTPENGCLYVVPETHNEAVVCPETADPSESFTTHLVRIPGNRKAMPVEMQPGDVLFFNGSLIHGSPPNRSTTIWRRSFISHYIPKSSIQVAKHYKPLLDFNGNDVSEKVPNSTDGGPCGHEFAGIGTYGKWH